MRVVYSASDVTWVKPVTELAVPVFPPNSIVSGYFVTRTATSAFGIVCKVTRQADKPGDEY